MSCTGFMDVIVILTYRLQSVETSNLANRVQGSLRGRQNVLSGALFGPHSTEIGNPGGQTPHIPSVNFPISAQLGKVAITAGVKANIEPKSNEFLVLER